MKTGLPVEKFIIAVNGNDAFPVYLKTGRYEKIDPSRNCLSSAMNVGHPSNLARLVALYNGVMDEKGIVHREADLVLMQKDIWSVSVDDQTTSETIKSCWEKYQVLLEPHGAVGWAGLQQYLSEHPVSEDQVCVSLETAHPAKFPEEIRQLLGVDPELPPGLAGIEEKTENYNMLPTNYAAFKDYLLSNFS